jgi:signal transduction histidine kinase
MSITDWLVDIVLCCGVFGFSLLQLSLSATLFIPDDFTRRILGIKSVTPSVIGIGVCVILCLPLIFRRKFPWPVFVADLAIWCLCETYLELPSLSLMSVLVALFTLAYERPQQESLIAGALCLGLVIAVPSAQSYSSINSLLLVQNCAIIAAATFVGYALHAHDELIAAAEARAAEAEHAREADALQAKQAQAAREAETERRLEEQRLEIAREIHDITGHSLSAVSIQAALAERLIDSNPKAAKEAVSTIRQTSKSALDDMRAIVGVLRGNETTPMQNSSNLNDLVDYLKSANIECSLDTSGYNPKTKPAYIDITFYKIAREAVTNIVRHSHATKASIKIWDEKLQSVLQITDNGDGLRQLKDGERRGHGIEGMRERARVLDGTFEMQTTPNGGLKITVSLPHKKSAHKIAEGGTDK